MSPSSKLFQYSMAYTDYLIMVSLNCSAVDFVYYLHILYPVPQDWFYFMTTVNNNNFEILVFLKW